MKSIYVVMIFLVASAFSGTATLSEGYEIGDIATDFELENIDGQMV